MEVADSDEFASDSVSIEIEGKVDKPKEDMTSFRVELRKEAWILVSRRT